MPAKRRAPPGEAAATAPKARLSKLAKEHNITAQEENEIKEAFALFSVSRDGEKEGVIPTREVKKAMIALGIAPTNKEFQNFVEILDPDDEGFTIYSSFVAICALKLNDRKGDNGGHDEEIAAAYMLFTNGAEGPITINHLKRVAAALKEDVSEDLLRDMILEANGGAGLQRGVQRNEFDGVMKRAGVWR